MRREKYARVAHVERAEETMPKMAVQERSKDHIGELYGSRPDRLISRFLTS